MNMDELTFTCRRCKETKTADHFKTWLVGSRRSPIVQKAHCLYCNDCRPIVAAESAQRRKERNERRRKKNEN